MAFSGGNLFAGILIVTILGARADHLGTHRSTSQRATMIEREKKKEDSGVRRDPAKTSPFPWQSDASNEFGSELLNGANFVIFRGKRVKYINDRESGGNTENEGVFPPGPPACKFTPSFFFP